MSAEVWILIATAVLAVVAIIAACVAIRAARRVAAAPSPEATLASEAPAPAATVSTAVVVPVSGVLEPRLVEGRLIIPPTQDQVVRTALGRPGVRLSIVVHGVAHALRAESRDRIAAMMRREYRRRRRERIQAGRRAVRDSRPTPPADEWLSS